MQMRYEKLEVWNLARELVEEVRKLKEKYKEKYQFSLWDQIWRSITSIPLNIAEGSGRGSDKDYARFVSQAIASLSESRANLQIALNQAAWENLESRIQELYFKLIAFRKTLLKSTLSKRSD
ncbi:four helix bundle protein [Candidatus Shapirobacteria bacterium CG10_big_fil_rev_8_21_14_0_10_40_9]|uniref:Four helix bundle protein n=1 Tax=Candidatus Shapirobacteria bacterium CG10_big_fil_rev_8_21_14_0_10_40_9 TaxID=1974888 RepID=A0A2M8L4J7_9BACT|nr:MAG: four helix bundle protein [Candidatus Shapirobacteria bacterium CG10_big_fil_rev_8_21_14_0_10_40_9]